SLALLLGSLIFDDLLNVGTPGHPYSGERAAHQYLVGMNTIPAVFVLVIETRRPKSGPSLLEGDVLHPIENLVGNLRAAIGEPFSVPIGCVFDYIFRREKSLLRRKTRSER